MIFPNIRNLREDNDKKQIELANYLKTGGLMIFPNIRNLREDNDKKQIELANYLNVKQTTYSKYELGKINVPIEIFIKLADYYDVSVDYLLGRTKEKK